MHRHRPGTFGLTTSAVLASMVITGFAHAKTHEVRIDPVAGTMTPSSLEISEGDVIRFVEEPNDDAIFADDFSSDLGWTSSATSLTGLWIRRIPFIDLPLMDSKMQIFVEGKWAANRSRITQGLRARLCT